MSARRVNKALPMENGLSISKRRAVFTCVSAVVIFYCVNGIVNAIGISFHWTHILINAQYRSLDSMPSPPGLLIFGDSAGLYSVHSEALADTLGTTVQSACTVAPVTPYTDAGIAERVISNTGRPRAMVFVYAIGSLEWEQRFNEAKYAGMGLMYYLPLLCRMSPIEAAENLLHSSLRLYGENPIFAVLLQKPWTYDGPEKIHRFFDQYRQDGGNIVMPQDQQDTVLLAENRAGYDEVYRDGFEISLAAEMGLERIAELSRKHRIHTFIALGPIERRFSSREYFLRYTEQYTAYLRNVTHEEPYLHMLSATPVYLPESELYDDVTHPSEPGALYYTGRLAAQIDSACTALGIDLRQ